MLGELEVARSRPCRPLKAQERDTFTPRGSRLACALLAPGLIHLGGADRAVLTRRLARQHAELSGVQDPSLSHAARGCLRDHSLPSVNYFSPSSDN